MKSGEVFPAEDTALKPPGCETATDEVSDGPFVSSFCAPLEIANAATSKPKQHHCAGRHMDASPNASEAARHLDGNAHG